MELKHPFTNSSNSSRKPTGVSIATYNNYHKRILQQQQQ